MKQQIQQITVLLVGIFVAKISTAVIEGPKVHQTVLSKIEKVLNLDNPDEQAKQWAHAKATNRLQQNTGISKPADNTVWSSLYFQMEALIPDDVNMDTESITESRAFHAFIVAEVNRWPKEYVEIIVAVAVVVIRTQPHPAVRLGEIDILVCAAIPASGMAKYGNIIKNTPVVKRIRTLLNIKPREKASARITQPEDLIVLPLQQDQPIIPLYPAYQPSHVEPQPGNSTTDSMLKDKSGGSSPSTELYFSGPDSEDGQTTVETPSVG